MRLPGVLAALAFCLSPGGCTGDGIGTSPADGSLPAASEAGADTLPDSDGLGRAEPQRLEHLPPARFQISAHVQTNIRTGVSYFVPPSRLADGSHAHLPYLECGAVGSSTERLPLVSGVFRHVPRGVDTRRDAIVVDGMDLDEALRRAEGATGATDEGAEAEGGGAGPLPPAGDGRDDDGTAAGGEEDEPDYPRRPSPPKYVVALTPLEIAVGGSSTSWGTGNETRRFDAGDVIFVEDTWWGVWDRDGESLEEEDSDENGTRTKKGYEIRPPAGTHSDLMTLMLTVPDAVHRRWKSAMFAAAEEDRRRRRRREEGGTPTTTAGGKDRAGHARPWWRVTSRALPTAATGPNDLPEACSLESDPTFTSSRVAPQSTLSDHLSRHFADVLRDAFSPSDQPRHAHRDLVMPVLVQGASGLLGGLVALVALLRSWKNVNSEVTVRFGSYCVLAGSTVGTVWLGERVWDAVGDWRERRRMARLVDGGWGRGRQ